MGKYLFLVISLVMVGGCSTMTPARYSISADNNQALKQYAGASVKISGISPPAEYSANCRMAGPIQAADGVTIPEFIKKAFNDEFKISGIYSEGGVVLQGSMTKIEFSSTSGLTGGSWDLGIVLTSPNGTTLQKTSHTEFKSGFDAITACNQTAQALGGAVQDLINAVVTDHKFAMLLK